MSYTKTARSNTTTTTKFNNNNNNANNNSQSNSNAAAAAYKASDRESVAFMMNAFPVRKLTNAAKIECKSNLIATLFINCKSRPEIDGLKLLISVLSYIESIKKF